MLSILVSVCVAGAVRNGSHAEQGAYCQDGLHAAPRSPATTRAELRMILSHSRQRHMLQPW
jgi:hypothetical protein